MIRRFRHALHRFGLALCNSLPGPRITQDLDRMTPEQRAWHEDYRG